jgi:hypothetical protein
MRRILLYPSCSKVGGFSPPEGERGRHACILARVTHDLSIHVSFRKKADAPIRGQEGVDQHVQRHRQ